MIYFLYKPTHGLLVAGWDSISIVTIDTDEVSIKWNMELWLYSSIL